MEDPKNPAHISVKNVSLSGMVTDFIKACPRDDVDLIIQGAIDQLIFKVVGDEDMPDFTSLLGDQVPLFAYRLTLESVIDEMPAILVGNFYDNGVRTNEYVYESREIAADIYIGTKLEIDELIRGWHKTGAQLNYL
jgi:hypothetical protein